MTGRIAIVSLGILAFFGAEPNGQSPIVVMGCMARAVNDGSLSGSPGVPPASPNNAPVLANSSEPTGAFVLNNGTVPEGKADALAETKNRETQVARSFQLDGSSAELEAHIGHQVEVTGTLKAPNVGATAEKTRIDEIQVTSIRMLATKCPRPSTPK